MNNHCIGCKHEHSTIDSANFRVILKAYLERGGAERKSVPGNTAKEPQGSGSVRLPGEAPNKIPDFYKVRL